MTREEAIKIVRNIYQTDAEKEALATLIPELAESEDERIIKTLQDYVKNRNWPLNGPTQDEVLAYLEKQKECLADNNKTSTDEDERIRKEINILYSDIDACITELLKARTDKDSESEGKALFKMEGLMVATLQDLSCIEDYLEKQKEPENTSASTMAPSCWQKEQKPKAKAKSPLSPHELYDAKIEGISQGRQDVLDHPEQFGLQKPAEWSEEDETRLTNILIMLKEYVIHHYSKDDVDKSVDWLENRLKSLRPQSKQEWTEKDEKMLNEVLDRVTYAFYNQGNKGEIEEDPAFLWLHKLRPSWKPSEEQMEALKRASTNEYLPAKQFDILVSLYEQLKKL